MCNMVRKGFHLPPYSTRMTNFIFQSYKEQSTKLAGQIAFLKMYCTRCAQDTARDAVQIFGGRGITQTGMGRFIEHASPLLAWHANVVADCL
jgi:alkylation response protein AidB-like acyl-CoA dehydrogenase